MPLYHSTRNVLSEGTIIAPGNWGMIIRAKGPSHPCWNREMALEAHRVHYYSDKPSRLNACFACACLATAIKYRDKNHPDAQIYEVEKVDPAAPEHRADFNVVEPLPGLPYSMEQIADLYWRSALWVNVAEWPGIKCEELVTPSAFRVVRVISKPALAAPALPGG